MCSFSLSAQPTDPETVIMKCSRCRRGCVIMRDKEELCYVYITSAAPFICATQPPPPSIHPPKKTTRTTTRTIKAHHSDQIELKPGKVEWDLKDELSRLPEEDQMTDGVKDGWMDRWM